MPAFYKIANDRRLVLSTASGVFTLADALAHQEQILADPDFNPQYSQLLDFTHVTKIELTAEDVCKLAERDIFHPTSSRAILVTNDLGEGSRHCSRYFVNMQVRSALEFSGTSMRLLNGCS